MGWKPKVLVRRRWGHHGPHDRRKQNEGQYISDLATGKTGRLRELRLQIKIIAGNSGIQYRSREVDKWVISGYQADFEAGEKYSGILYEEKARGILAERGQKIVIEADGKKREAGNVDDSEKIQAAIKKEDWNDYTIIARGNHLIHKINGLTTVDVTDNQVDKRAMSGLLALQVHAGPAMTVQFRNVRLKRLQLAQAKKKVVMVAGTPSHAPGHHEFNAGGAPAAKTDQRDTRLPGGSPP